MFHYFFYIALFGVLVLFILWLRDCRIYMRTSLPGYRKGAVYGVGCNALATFGAGWSYLYPQYDLLGLAFVLIGLYIQGKVERETVFSNQSAWERLTGKTPIDHLLKKNNQSRRK